MDKPVVIYVPITEPTILLDGCQALVKGVLERIIEKQINGFAEYTSESSIIRVQIKRIEFIFEEKDK